MKRLFLIIILTGAAGVFAQKNTAFIELLGNGGFASLNYERQLTKQPGLSLRLGFGVSFWELGEREDGSSEGSGCVCPELNFPDADLSIPFSLQYLIPLWKTNYLETGLGYTYQFGSAKRNESNTNVFYGSVGFRRHFGRTKGWMWKVSFTPVLRISDSETKNSGIGPWAGIALGKRF
ncbi:hypothetical protein N9954_02870 [Maribacter sp.]|nr:hypothetical protein [Maribacter sp.]